MKSEGRVWADIQEWLLPVRLHCQGVGRHLGLAEQLDFERDVLKALREPLTRAERIRAFKQSNPRVTR